MKNSNLRTSGRWSSTLINGLITLSIGLLLVFAPKTIYHIIVVSLGIIIFLGGLFSLVYANKAQSLSLKNKSFWYIQAIINIIIGIFIFFKPDIVLSLIQYFISIWLILIGGIQLFYSANQKKIFGRLNIMLANGILTLFVGILFLIWPEFPLVFIGYINIFISIILFYYAIVFYNNRNQDFTNNYNDIEDAEIIEETKL